MTKPRKQSTQKPAVSQKGMDRRGFLKTTAIVASGAALRGASLPGTSPSHGRAVVGDTSYPRVFAGTQRKMIAFPLGGVGAGSISLGGRGQLMDWQIFNRPDKGSSPQYAFASIWAQSGRRRVARVLEARIQPPYEGASGLGFANVPGLPRLESSIFAGEFPIAHVDFEDSQLPVRVSLEALTPFVPLESDDSGLPAVILRYRVTNPLPTAAKVSVAFSLENPVGRQGGMNDFRQSGTMAGLLMRNPFLAATDPLAGSFVVAILDAGTDCLTYLRGWQSAKWWESPLLFWDDFSEDGNLGPEPQTRGTTGSLCLQREIPSHAQRDYTFLLTWYFPNRTPERCGWTAPKGHEKDVIGNHYCTRFADAFSAAEYVAAKVRDLEQQTRQFTSAIRETTLPAAVREAAMANLAALTSPTSFRTADGHFHGFEGCMEHVGCCFGSCTHVWNYEAATASLFPSLSRSFREQQFGFSTDENGRMDFRELLPSNIERWGFAAADGQMGSIIKLYLDWRLSGDTEWLKRLWPNAKRALEFAWVRGGWDANRDGVMEGVQHNTYDVEFVGPNPLCGVWYLGALRGAEEMATALGDMDSARQYRNLFQQGSRWIDDNLFNGEFYIQKVGSVAPHEVAQGLLVGMGTVDTEHPEFQLGEGCLVDQLVGQYLAQVAGLGFLLDRQNVVKTLQSIYKYNYKRTLYDHESVARTFALNDEAALVICDYSQGKRPRTPFPYFQEVMTGFEYSAAILMLYVGMLAEGVELIENIRRRYDGERRNPWDEAECGFHYARPMASWSALLALSGFRYDGKERTIEAKPRVANTHFSSFWSTGLGWGSFSDATANSRREFALSVLGGYMPCHRVVLHAARQSATEKSIIKVGARLIPHQLHHEWNDAHIVFADVLELNRGDRLVAVL